MVQRHTTATAFLSSRTEVNERSGEPEGFYYEYNNNFVQYKTVHTVTQNAK